MGLAFMDASDGPIRAQFAEGALAFVVMGSVATFLWTIFYRWQGLRWAMTRDDFWPYGVFRTKPDGFFKKMSYCALGFLWGVSLAAGVLIGVLKDAPDFIQGFVLCAFGPFGAFVVWYVIRKRDL